MHIECYLSPLKYHLSDYYVLYNDKHVFPCIILYLEVGYTQRLMVCKIQRVLDSWNGTFLKYISQGHYYKDT